MFQPDFDERSGSRAAGRMGKLAFVVGDPAESRSITSRAEYDTQRQPGDDEAAKWLNERLTACYND
jgi:hypothetical protein